MISRDKEIDVAVGDIRMVILIHQKSGNKFLWPVLRQQPQESNSEGILGGLKKKKRATICLYYFKSDLYVKSVLLHCILVLLPALKPVYEEMQTIPITKLKINNQEIYVTRYITTQVPKKICIN